MSTLAENMANLQKLLKLPVNSHLDDEDKAGITTNYSKYADNYNSSIGLSKPMAETVTETVITGLPKLPKNIVTFPNATPVNVNIPAELAGLKDSLKNLKTTFENANLINNVGQAVGETGQPLPAPLPEWVKPAGVLFAFLMLVKILFQK